MTTTVKTCFKCHAVKHITEFYKHPMMGDGRLNKCKECTRNDVRANYQKRIDYYREYDRRRGFRPGKAGKMAARNAVNHAILAGRLIRQPCEMPPLITDALKRITTITANRLKCDGCASAIMPRRTRMTKRMLRNGPVIPSQDLARL